MTLCLHIYTYYIHDLWRRVSLTGFGMYSYTLITYMIYEGVCPLVSTDSRIVTQQVESEANIYSVWMIDAMSIKIDGGGVQYKW